MIRNLLVIAAASFVLLVVCFAGAVAVGGRELREHGWTIPGDVFIEEDGDSIHISSVDPSSPVVERSEAWNVGPALQIDIPADVTYTQGATAKVVLSGPKEIIDRIRIDNGQLRFASPDDERGMHAAFRRQRVKVSITAPSATRFVLNSSSALHIVGYDQPQLALEVNGSGDIDATGKAQTVTVDISGSGEVDLSPMVIEDATVDIAGSGDARLGPRGVAKVSIAGSGDVDLTVKPGSLTSDIAGSGDLRLPD